MGVFWRAESKGLTGVANVGGPRLLGGGRRSPGGRSWRSRRQGMMLEVCAQVSGGEEGSGAHRQPSSGEQHLRDGRGKNAHPGEQEGPPGKGEGAEGPKWKQNGSRRRLRPVVNAAEGQVRLEKPSDWGMRKSHVTLERAVSVERRRGTSPRGPGVMEGEKAGSLNMGSLKRNPIMWTKTKS